MTSPQKTFVRDATGVIRSISPVQLLMYTIFFTSWGAGITLLITSMPSVLPGADMGLTFVLAIPFVLALALLYTWFTEAIPRSGGDYVWISRSINPAIALGLGFLFVVFEAFFEGSSANFITSSVVAPGVGLLGITSGNPSLTGMASSLSGVAPVLAYGTIIIVIMLAMTVISLKQYLRVQTVLWIVAIATLVLWFYSFAVTSNTQFVRAFDSNFGRYNTTYGGVISSAAAAGDVNPGLVVLGLPTILGIAYAFFFMNGFQFGAYFGGELKEARRGMYYAAVAGGLISCFVDGAAGFLSQHVMGANFLNAVTSGMAKYSVPIPFSAYFMSIVMLNNFPLGIITLAGALVWWLMAIVTVALAAIRLMFAWGFDRAAPAPLGYVSDRFHTPVVAAVVFAIISEVGLLLSVYAGVIFGFINTTLMLVVLFTFAGLAGVIYPYRRRNLFQLSTIATRRVGGVPALTIIGGVVAVMYGFLIWFSLAYPSLSGPTGPFALGLFGLVFALGVGTFYVSRAYYGGKGIVIDYAFREIPPE